MQLNQTSIMMRLNSSFIVEARYTAIFFHFDSTTLNEIR